MVPRCSTTPSHCPHCRMIPVAIRRYTVESLVLHRSQEMRNSTTPQRRAVQTRILRQTTRMLVRASSSPPRQLRWKITNLCKHSVMVRIVKRLTMPRASRPQCYPIDETLKAECHSPHRRPLFLWTPFESRTNHKPCRQNPPKNSSIYIPLRLIPSPTL